MGRRDRKKREAASEPEAVAAEETMVPEPAGAEPTDLGPSEPKRVTPVDIQQKEFRVAFRGYNERDVDVFLDEITEEVARLFAENKRLREEIEVRAASGLPGADEADAIVRQARLEAERILADARANAAAVGASGPAGAESAGPLTADEAATARVLIGAFLAREREFLQTMAGLIQDHAQAVKDNAAQAKDQITAGTAGAAAGVPAAGAARTAAAGHAGPVPPEPAAGGPGAPAVTPGPPRSAPPAPVPVPQAPRPVPPAAGPPPPAPVAVRAVESEPRPTPVPAARVPEGHAPVATPEAAPTPVPPLPSTLLDPAPESVGGGGEAAEAGRGADPLRGVPLPPRPAGRESPAGPSTSAPPAEGEDRSIQELFWGEI